MIEGSDAASVSADAEEATLAQSWAQLREQGCARARERLFEHYCRYAQTLASHAHRDRGVGELDDVRQWAYLGLLEAIDRFDPARGVGFATFATTRIRGSIQDGVRRSCEVHEQRSLHARLRRERLQSLRDGATSTQPLHVLCELATGLAVGLLLEGTGLYVEGVDTPCARPSGYDAIAWEQRRRIVAGAVVALPERLQAVIRLHYNHRLPFAQIATVLGISAARASQLHQAALCLLREQMRPKLSQWSE
jgi:RNA polymerase sigma factor for flagellar operon FliA